MECFRNPLDIYHISLFKKKNILELDRTNLHPWYSSREIRFSPASLARELQLKASWLTENVLWELKKMDERDYRFETWAWQLQWNQRNQRQSDISSPVSQEIRLHHDHQFVLLQAIKSSVVSTDIGVELFHGRDCTKFPVSDLHPIIQTCQGRI